METEWGAFGPPFGPLSPGLLARRYDSGAGPRLNSRPARRKCGRSIWLSDSVPTPDPFDCWRRCPRTDSVYAGRRRFSFGYFQDPS